jgi:DNA-binding LacI/PurR family transcriptional regulator
MSESNEKPSAKYRVQAFRDRLRAQGFRPIQIWVPDVRSEEFVRQAHLQSVAASRSAHGPDDQDFIDEISADV